MTCHAHSADGCGCDPRACWQGNLSSVVVVCHRQHFTSSAVTCCERTGQVARHVHATNLKKMECDGVKPCHPTGLLLVRTPTCVRVEPIAGTSCGTAGIRSRHSEPEVVLIGATTGLMVGLEESCAAQLAQDIWRLSATIAQQLPSLLSHNCS